MLVYITLKSIVYDIVKICKNLCRKEVFFTYDSLHLEGGFASSEGASKKVSSKLKQHGKL